MENMLLLLVTSLYFVKLIQCFPQSLVTTYVKLEKLPKHVVFVLDVSGSMGGEKIGQLKDSLVTVLDDMTETDYFNIITFSDGVSHWNPLEKKSEGIVRWAQKIIQATKENKNLAIKHFWSK